jgi:cytosine/adenosine deaminase-related metal-dependent hydrolase
MTQATLTQERTEKKALSVLGEGLAQGHDAVASGLFYTPQRTSVKELFEAAREAAQRAVPKVQCGLCGREESVLSQEYYRSGQQVCAECFDQGLQEWLKERRQKKSAKAQGG